MSPRDMSELNERAALEAYRTAACAEADAHFDDRALENQRHRILARLAHLGQTARVIRFPKAPLGEVQTGGVNRRWITVAAAAGLLIGLLGGQIVHLVPQPARRLAPTVASTAPATKAPGPTFAPAIYADDDGLLGEIDLVMQVRSSATELRVLDELTPFYEPQ